MHRLTQISLAHPKIALLVIAIVTLVMAGGLTRLRTEFGYRVLLGDDHPSIRTLDGLIERFGGGLPIRIAWECGSGHPCASVFDRTSLEMAGTLSLALSRLSAVRSVQGPSNAVLLVPVPDGFAVRRFLDGGIVAADAQSLARRAVEDPLWVGTFVSADGMVGAILVQPRDTRSETDLIVLTAIEEVIAPFEAQGFEYYLVGDTIGTVVSGRDLAQSMASLVPVTVLVIGLILYALSRSWRASLIGLSTIGLALGWTFGLLGWLDWPRDGILEILAPLLLAVGVCDSIHMISRYATEANEAHNVGPGEQVRLLLGVSQDLSVPCLLTSVTTAAAFLSFTTSALDTFVRFGAIAAFGVLVCLLLTFTLLPVLLYLIPPDSRGMHATSRSWDSALQAVVRTGQRRSVPILTVSCALLIVFGLGWMQFLKVDTDWYDSFGEESRVMKWVHFAEQHFGLSSTLEVELRLPPNETFESPETIGRIRRFSEFLAAVDGHGSVTSALDLMARLNRLLHDDDPAYERTGDTEEANAELLELVAFGGSGVLSNWLSLDRTSARISVKAEEQPYSALRENLDSVRDFAAAEFPEGWTINLSGHTAMNVDWIEDVQGTQLRSFPAAVLLVFALVAVFLRSIRLAAAAMVPTVLPVVVTLGAMGLVGMSLDIGRAMIGAIVIGVGVDDSVHLLSQYKRRRSLGMSPSDAMASTVMHIGRAVITTSAALALGFLTLIASPWQTISSFGFFVSLAILGALAASLYVLPAMFFAVNRGDRHGQ